MPQLNLTEQAPGTASSVRISQACLAYGFQVIPVDSASAPGMRSLVLDLRNVGEQILLLEIIHRCQPLLIWMAPPCGTSSRAREVLVDPASGLPPSRPLRSEMFPDGLPDLCSTAAARVRSANELYAFTAILIEAARDISSLWVVEQTLRSLAWHTSWLAPHVQDGVMNQMHFCAFGGQRLKRTGLLSDRQLPALVCQCAGDHPHLPWRGTKGFRTAEETAFANALRPFALPRQKLEASNQSRPAWPYRDPVQILVFSEHSYWPPWDNRGVANRPQQCLRHTRQLLQQLMWWEQPDQVPKCSMHPCLKALFWPMCSPIMTPASF